MTRRLIAVTALLLLSGCGPSFDGGATGRVRDAIHVAYSAGFTSEPQLLAVVSIGVAESSLRPTARNWHPEYGTRPDGTTHADRGLWQISSYWWPQYTDEVCDDPPRAARAVYEISEGGRDFAPWDTYRNGAAQAHYDRAVNGWPVIRPLVRDYLESR